MDRLRLVGITASLALVLVAVALAVFGGGEGGDQAVDTAPRIVSRDDLVSLEGDLGHPVYWLGARPADRLELTREAGGSIYLRYLPSGVAAGEQPAAFLTVGTYPVPDAEAALRRAAAAAGSRVRPVAGGGVVFDDPESKRSAYLAYPDSDLQVEVYHPDPGRAAELVDSGLIRSVSE